MFGILALFIPPLITLGITVSLGWLFLASGIIALLVYSWAYAVPGFRSLLFSAVLSVIAGIALLLRPVSGAISLTVILIVFFAFGGVALIVVVVAALERRKSASSKTFAPAHRSDFAGLNDRADTSKS